MTAITTLYECRTLQSYEGLKEVIINVNSCSAGDTIDLAAFTGVSSTNKSYKNTKAVVDAAQLKVTTPDSSSGITTAIIRYAEAFIPSTGAFVPMVASSSATLTVGEGPSNSEIEVKNLLQDLLRIKFISGGWFNPHIFYY
jgi:hypothetical protein